MSLLSPLVLSLLLACGEEEQVVEEVQEVVAEPAQPKAPSKQDLLKDFKIKNGNTATNTQLFYLGERDTQFEFKKEQKAYFTWLVD